LIELIKNKIIAHLKWIMHFGWVKGHAGIEGIELVDTLVKEAAVEDGRQDAKKGDYNAREAKWTSYVTTAVDEYGERGSVQSFLPVSEE